MCVRYLQNIFSSASVAQEVLRRRKARDKLAATKAELQQVGSCNRLICFEIYQKFKIKPFWNLEIFDGIISVNLSHSILKIINLKKLKNIMSKPGYT